MRSTWATCSYFTHCVKLRHMGPLLWPITVICSVTLCQHLIPVLKRAAVAWQQPLPRSHLHPYLSRLLKWMKCVQTCRRMTPVTERSVRDKTGVISQHIMSEHCFKKTKSGYFKSAFSSIFDLSFNINPREVRHGQNVDFI